MTSNTKIKANNKRRNSTGKVSQTSRRKLLRPRRIGNFTLAEIRKAILEVKSNSKK
jgi:hypothetical protein